MMNEDEKEANVDQVKIVDELYWLAEQCEIRCLFECSKWTNEIICHLPPSTSMLMLLPTKIGQPQVIDLIPAQSTAKTQYDLQDPLFRTKTKFFLEKIELRSPVDKFLYYFSWYMISVQTRLEEEANDTERKTEFVDSNLADLRQKMESLKEKSPESFDCFLNYLLGVVRKDNDASEDACKVFREAIDQDYRCWPAWKMLSIR
uniref:Cdc23 domain-containing protein n=1 Tax=Ditylenchus dipsaci TaxID=166011 RepID=A0A915D0E6_9BILA